MTETQKEKVREASRVKVKEEEDVAEFGQGAAAEEKKRLRAAEKSAILARYERWLP
jgi:hypothetical protein